MHLAFILEPWWLIFLTFIGYLVSNIVALKSILALIHLWRNIVYKVLKREVIVYFILIETLSDDML